MHKEYIEVEYEDGRIGYETITEYARTSTKIDKKLPVKERPITEAEMEVVKRKGVKQPKSFTDKQKGGKIKAAQR